MTNALQTYLSEATTKKNDELIEAYLRLPEDRRNWAPEGCRSAVNQMAEVLIINAAVPHLLEHKSFPPDFSMDKYMAQLAEAMAYSDLTDKIKAGVSALNEVILAIPDSELSAEVSMPWGTQTVADISAYSFQNSCYHLGQINYIAMMNGVTIP